MSHIGHNGGPTLEPGYGFRKVAWTKARKSLLKTLPIEILRVRVARADCTAALCSASSAARRRLATRLRSRIDSSMIGTIAIFRRGKRLLVKGQGPVGSQHKRRASFP